ncbi:F-box/kelch-repeat protein At3g23880-like [Vicia villosa]|uniref:F-box/kelch-repeat protein At3g23880-like n=1 Tax=Vicia villosa TaxID=3911 RepID=UPI00273AC97A|nr:F-box/kelch-repeat protein At3g23880-like [Vicia villosa]
MEFFISLDSNFARKQLSLSTSRRDHHHLFLSSTRSSREFLLCHSTISSFFTSASLVTVKHLSQTLTGVLNNGRTRLAITTCDGILCFGIDESLAVLYNPSTGKSKVLPPLKTCFQNLYTLVYDRMASNYKVIAIGYFNSIVGVNIHTLGTDYWTSIQDFPCSNHISKPGIFVNDTINWIAYDTNLPRDNVIISLDLEKESYQKLSPPLYNDDDTGSELPVALGTLRGC